MMGEIDRDFYCSADSYGNTGGCAFYAESGHKCDEKLRAICGAFHRKHPTPKQFKEEYGEKYPDDGAVYCYTFDGGGYSWVAGTYKWAKEWRGEGEPIVCACTPFTPFDKPGKDRMPG